jgi:YD repeat-containing protein
VEGRVVNITRSEGMVSHAMNYGYDDATGRHTKTWTSNSEWRYGHDVLGRLESVDDVTAGLKTSYAFSVVGNVTQVVTKQGTATLKTTTNSYDPVRHWLVSVANTGSTGNTLSNFTYDRRADGQVLKATESVLQPDGSTATSTATFTYDALNRLTQEVVDSSVVGQDYTKTYTLDMVGNRTKLVTSKEGLPTETTISTYNSRHQLLTETTGSTTINYGYDDNGSLITQNGNGSSRTQAWDVRGRLQSAVVDGVVTSYDYTSDGIRSRVSVDGVTANYIVDSMTPSGYAQVVEELASGVLAVRYTYGASLDPVSETRNGSTSVYLADGHSGVRQAISLAGAVLMAQRFDAYGVSVAKVGTLSTREQRHEWAREGVGSSSVGPVSVLHLLSRPS